MTRLILLSIEVKRNSKKGVFALTGLVRFQKGSDVLIPSNPGKCLKMAANPTSQVCSVLGNHEPARTLAIKKAQSLTDKLAP
jgi:hypothetical protein